MKTDAFSWRSLKTRVTVLTLGIFAIGIVAMAFHAKRVLREDMRRLIGEQQLSTASFIAADIDQALDDRLRSLESVAAKLTPALLGDPAALQAFIDDRRVLARMFNSGLIVCRRHGTAIAEVPQSTGRIGVNYIDRDTVAAALGEGRTTVGQPVMGRKLKAPVIGMTAPIRDADGKVVGALLGIVNLALPNFLDGITANRYGRSGSYVLVAPQQRRVIAASDRQLVMAELPAPGVNALSDRLADGREGSVVGVGLRGVEELVAVKEVPLAGWHLGVMLPTEEVFAPIGALGRRLLAAALILALPTGTLIWWLLRRELAPVVDTAATLARLSDGHAPLQPLPVSGRDEIGGLIGGFNRLLASLGRREQALRESERFKQSIMDSVAAEIAVLDRDGVITAINEPWRRFAADNGAGAGKPAPQVDVGTHYLAACAAGTDAGSNGARAARDGIEAVLDGRLPSFSIDYPCDSPQQQRWFNMLVTPLRDTAQGGAVVAHTDITPRKRAEAAERAAREQIEAITDATPGVVYRFLRTPAGDWRFLHISKGIRELYGVEPEDALRDHNALTSRILPEDRASHRESIEASARSLGAWTHEHRIAMADGSVKWVRAWARPHLQTDGGTLWTGILVDVTDRKLAEAVRASFEANLREAQKTEAVGTLAGGIAREFNNAVATILGNVMLARQDLGANPRVVESLDEIRKAGERARDLVQQILAFSQGPPTERAPTTLAPVVVEAVLLLRTTLPAQVTLDVHCETDLPTVLADAMQIKQALLNLVTNAVQAIEDEPGHVVIRLDAVPLDAALAESHPALFAMRARNPGRVLRLAVSDDGPGIDAATLGRIFDPFYTTKRGDRSAGMGLPVAQAIAQAHEGAIAVESRPGQGSTFTLYLPAVAETVVVAATAPAPGAAAAPPAPQRADHGRRILYVDDDEALVFLVERLLERLLSLSFLRDPPASFSRNVSPRSEATRQGNAR